MTNADPASSPAPSQPRDSWRLIGLLVLASLVGSLMVIPFAESVRAAAKTPDGKPRVVAKATPAEMAPSVAASTLFTALVIIFGLRAGRKVGLGQFMLAGWDEGTNEPRRLLHSLALASGVGVGVFLFDFVLSKVMEPYFPDRELDSLAGWQGFLAAFGAGVNEEILCRLGFMSVIALMISGVTRAGSGNSIVITIANFFAALAFASLHLPQAAVLYGLTTPVVIVVMIGNTVPGLLFGWLFWKRGLIAAMIAHTVADIILYGIAPFVGG